MDCLKSVSGVADARMVTAMCGNGVEFWVKVRGAGVHRCHGFRSGVHQTRLLPEVITDTDAVRWSGNRNNVEAFGLGVWLPPRCCPLLRRFDKSLTISTLKATLQCKLKLFKGLVLENKPFWRLHPIIHLDWDSYAASPPQAC